jgi:hypothetical protein
VCIDIDEDGELVCEELPEAGENCLGESGLCGAYLVCDQAEQRCDPAPGVGDECSPIPAACGEGLYCHESGMCASLPPEGEACVMGQCAAGRVCDGMGICQTEDPLTCSAGPQLFRLRF